MQRTKAKDAYQQGVQDGAMIAINHAIIEIMELAQSLAKKEQEPRVSDIIHLANTLADNLDNNKVIP